MRFGQRTACISLAAFTWLAACNNSKPVTGGDAAPGTTDGKADEDGEELGDTGTVAGEGDFKGCGYTSFDETKDLIDQKIGSAQIKLSGFAGTIFTTSYDVRVKGSLTFKGGLDTLTATSAFDVVSADPENARAKAEEEIRGVTGTRVATMLPGSDWPDLFSGDWDGIHCSILPATTIKETVGTHTTTVEFDPPLPFLVTPLMTASRFQQEIGSEKVFNDIKAKVVSTTNPKLQGISSKDGTVTISKVDPTANFTDTQGRALAVKASYAYKVEFDFGNHEITSALGLYKVATYYVKKGKFYVITIETGVPDAPIVNYINE